MENATLQRAERSAWTESKKRRKLLVCHCIFWCFLPLSSRRAATPSTHSRNLASGPCLPGSQSRFKERKSREKYQGTTYVHVSCKSRVKPIPTTYCGLLCPTKLETPLDTNPDQARFLEEAGLNLYYLQRLTKIPSHSEAWAGGWRVQQGPQTDFTTTCLGSST